MELRTIGDAYILIVTDSDRDGWEKLYGNGVEDPTHIDVEDVVDRWVSESGERVWWLQVSDDGAIDEITCYGGAYESTASRRQDGSYRIGAGSPDDTTYDGFLEEERYELDALVEAGNIANIEEPTFKQIDVDSYWSHPSFTAAERNQSMCRATGTR